MTNQKKPAKSAQIKTNPVISTNRQAAEMMIQALRDTGRIQQLDEARVAIMLKLATMVDDQPENPALWREYRAAEKSLREETATADDPFDALVRSLSTQVGNETKSETPKPRR